MPLYEVQDGDRPLFVVATDWADALEAWRKQCVTENPGTEETDHDPLGVRYVSSDDEFIISHDWKGDQ